MKFKNIFHLIFFSLLFFNLTFFLFKISQVLFELERRNAQTANAFIKKNISKGSKVIGDPLFFYAVTNNDSYYHYYDLYNTLKIREQILRNTFDYDYMLISGLSLSRNPNIAAHFISQSEFDTVATLQLETNSVATFINSLGLVSSMEASGYNCTLLKRIKNKK